MVTAQKLLEVEPYGLTCVFILTCGLIGKFLLTSKLLVQQDFLILVDLR